MVSEVCITNENSLELLLKCSRAFKMFSLLCMRTTVFNRIIRKLLF